MHHGGMKLVLGVLELSWCEQASSYSLLCPAGPVRQAQVGGKKRKLTCPLHYFSEPWGANRKHRLRGFVPLPLVLRMSASIYVCIWLITFAAVMSSRRIQIPKLVLVHGCFSLLGGPYPVQVLEEIVCIGLAGICAEYVVYGVSEGGITDIQQVCLPTSSGNLVKATLYRGKDTSVRILTTLILYSIAF